MEEILIQQLLLMPPYGQPKGFSRKNEMSKKEMNVIK